MCRCWLQRLDPWLWFQLILLRLFPWGLLGRSARDFLLFQLDLWGQWDLVRL